jgi:hypothetical protein
VRVSTAQANAESNVWYILYTTISIYFYQKIIIYV